jgi:hypothetical protein
VRFGPAFYLTWFHAIRAVADTMRGQVREQGVNQGN